MLHLRIATTLHQMLQGGVTSVVSPMPMPRCSEMADSMVRDPASMQGVVPHTIT